MVKKILIVHNNYQNTGGEDLAVANEVALLKKDYIVDTLFFLNKIDNYLSTIFWLIFGTNKQSENKLKKRLKNFSLILHMFTILGLRLLPVLSIL